MIVKAEPRDKPLAKGHGHFYRADGTPLNEVPMATRKGEMRPTNIADCRKLKLHPGTTSYTGLASKFDPDISPFIKAAMELGTEVHAALEDYSLHKPYSMDHRAICLGVRDWYNSHGMNIYDVIPESTILAGKCGYGGSIDSICTDNDGQHHIIDYKTCKTKRGVPSTPLTYKMQITAYKIAKELEDPKYTDAKKTIVYVSTDEPGRVFSKEIQEEEYLWDIFKRCYRAFNGINRLLHLEEKLA